MQFKTMMRYHYPLVTMAKIQVEQQEVLFTAMVITVQIGWLFLTKPNILTTQYNSHASWYSPTGAESLCPHIICTQILTRTLFTIAKTWKQSRYPPINE
jgi:hypothetical protein